MLSILEQREGGQVLEEGAEKLVPLEKGENADRRSLKNKKRNTKEPGVKREHARR